MLRRYRNRGPKIVSRLRKTKRPISRDSATDPTTDRPARTPDASPDISEGDDPVVDGARPCLGCGRRTLRPTWCRDCDPNN